MWLLDPAEAARLHAAGRGQDRAPAAVDMRKPVYVRVFAVPDVRCGGHAMTWSGATSLINERLKRRFGECVETELVEIFSPRSFEFPSIMAEIASGSQLPIVTVGDQVISRGGKLSDRKIVQAIEALLL